MGSKNGKSFISAFFIRFIAFLTVAIVITIGGGLGLTLAMTSNIKNEENFIEYVPALPTKILDANGNLITEFSAEEKRELVSLSELPRHLIYAVLAREDPDFYNHRGFSIRAIVRAVWGQINHYMFGGQALGGGSTITQQLAGTLYTNRTEISITRKIKELWWAFQMERRYTKNEILEIYLNNMPMGPDTYGVETASKYFFGHSARDVTLAEAAVLAVLLSGPSRFDPIKNPNLAMDRQHFVLERMIEFGYADEEEAEASFKEFWANFDWTRPALSAYLTREDKAPWFSEYVRRELDVLMYGARDYFRDGYVVYTTLNLEHQEAAEKYMAQGLAKGNAEYAALNRRSNSQAIRSTLPIINLLTLAFNLTDVHSTAVGQNEVRATSRYTRTINPVVDLLALAFGIPELKDITNPGFAMLRETTRQNVVEGALISIENETGYITAIVGGSKYDESNQFIRATQAAVQPGSAFKPLYYSAALDTGRFTSASMIYDIPMAFHNEDGTFYVPNNYNGQWRGPLLLYNILALSLNIPSLYVLEAIGFDAAIDRAASLLGITNQTTINRLFPRVYPLGLGITSVSPAQMARAFAVFGNQGRDVTLIAIKTIEDRNGRVIFDVEREVRQKQRRLDNGGQVISPQNAYAMTRLMEFGVTIGTLGASTGYGSRFNYRDEEGRTFRIPAAGKTGTTQNWSDAWSVGYTPYYTTAVWFGFDQPGNSLGISQTGAQLAGPVWGDYMSDIHRGLPQKTFVRPTGVSDAAVCRRSGLLPTESCNEGTIYLTFIDGTIPSRYCDIHGAASSFLGANIPVSSAGFSNIDTSFLDDYRIDLDWDFLENLLGFTQSSNTFNQFIFGAPSYDETPNNPPPANNQNTSPRNEPAVIPDAPVRFVPREDDDNNNDLNDNGFDNDETLPPWDLMG